MVDFRKGFVKTITLPSSLSFTYVRAHTPLLHERRLKTVDIFIAGCFQQVFASHLCPMTKNLVHKNSHLLPIVQKLL